MEDSLAQLDTLVELAGRLGIEVRKEHLAGSGGGLCTVRGRQVLFVDLDADPATQLDSCLKAAAQLPSIESVYLPPILREGIERLRTSH